MKTIAVDLDDTLNDFSEVLRTSEVPREVAGELSAEVFAALLERVRKGEDEGSGLTVTEYTYFRARVHMWCFERAAPRPGAAEFLSALRREGWRIVICTRRDLRRTHAGTRRWLAAQGLPCDYLFTAANKIAFCGLWRIPFLVDDDPFSIEHGGRFGVQVFFPAAAQPPGSATPGTGARAFGAFGDIWPWIRA